MRAIGLFLVSINHIHSQILSPECNYAAEGVNSHFYPIGACDKTKTVTNVSTYSAFRYICQNNEVFKYEYNTDEYCDGQAISSTNYTDQLVDFECNLGVCDYSNTCGYTGCYNPLNESCAECETNKQNYSRHCIPFITDHCMGNPSAELVYDECIEGVLTEYSYDANNCTITPTSDFITGGADTQNNCYGDTYYEVDCVARSLPLCNYAATDHHSYPLGACATTKTTNITTANTQYFAFEYVCDNNNDIYRNEYDTSEYCQAASPVTSTQVNDLLQHYDCGLSDCEYADSCTLILNGCSAGGCDYDTECLPMIINNCIGFVGEALHYARCGNAVLNESFYFYSMDCDVPVYSDSVIGDVDDAQCGEELYHKVQCIDSSTSPASVVYHDTQCTQTPTVVPTLSPTKSAQVCDSEDIGWKVGIRLRFEFSKIPTTDAYLVMVMEIVLNGFVRTISLLGDFVWTDEFCVVIADDELKIEQYEADDGRRRLLQTEMEYEIEVEFEYNDAVQDAFFATDLYDKDTFGDQFGEFTRDGLFANDFINADVNAEGIMVFEIVDESKSGHVVEGRVINTVSIMSIIDVLIFFGCVFYVFMSLKKRSVLEGNCLWSEVFKQIGLVQYIVLFVEVFVFIIDWIFVIDLIVVDKTYLGWIGFMLLIFAAVVLYFRYSLYKKLCVYQINDIVLKMKDVEAESDSEKKKNWLIEEIRFRQVDVGMMGVLLASVQDIPVIILLVIIGDNWDYYAIVVLCFIMSLVSIAMKIGLLFGAKFDEYKSKRYARKTSDMVELADKLAEEKPFTGTGGAETAGDDEKTDEKAKTGDGDEQLATATGGDVDVGDGDKKTDKKAKTGDGDEKTDGGDGDGDGVKLQTDDGNKKTDQVGKDGFLD